MCDDLPELIDLSTKQAEKNDEKKDQFKLVGFKNKTSSKKNKDVDMIVQDSNQSMVFEDEDDAVDSNCTMQMDKIDPLQKISFPPIAPEKLRDGKYEIRKIHVPSNRFNPLKENWMKVYSPVVEYLKLQIRFNLKTRNVELKVRNKFKIYFQK